MPGTRLNITEQRLESAWKGGRFGQFPLLKSIAIQAPDGRGLRGIRKLELDFNYPVTFLSGQNGSGKSTLLSLAALGYHGLMGHFPTNARRRTGEGDKAFGYYTFQDFFHRGPGDADLSGIQISWQYSTGNPVSIKKQSDKWMRYERRPSRPVEFLGLSRAVPAIELPTLRNHFGVSAAVRSAPLTEEALTHLEQVLGRKYPGAETVRGARYTIRRSGREGGYTSFNMGTGEDALIGLLARLCSIPKGSLVIIEELETGLHPAAQQRAAQALIEIGEARQLQIIGSTHSHHVLDQLPRQARVLVVRESTSHRVVPSPSTRFALSEMAESSETELAILCEDEFAALLIRQLLPKALRRRVQITSCGAKSELAFQARSYLRLTAQARCLILWDGDVTAVEAESYINKASERYPGEDVTRRLSWSNLPGTICPEKWSLEVARTVGLEIARAQFNFDSVEEALEILNRCGLGDPHDIAHELATQTGLTEPIAANTLAACCASAVLPDKARLVSRVEASLAGAMGKHTNVFLTLPPGAGNKA